ncbi:MAG: septation protein SepH [Gordonia sp. (in: high G+C Gram-positive bacteria)]
MRELRVIGIDADGSHVICQDAESGERFRLDADERLRAAARGDLSRLGQIEIAMDSSLRPREIQARIRAGASVAEVAAIAKVPVERIERFAHPVLLERTRATELAALAHPLRHDGPTVSTLGDVVAQGLAAYGHNPTDAEWDAWKGEDGFWVVQVNWQVGHTDHHAHWRFHPGSHGGTADPLDDLAEELTHPETIQPRRRLIPVGTPAIAPGPDGHYAGRDDVTVDANSLIGSQRSRHLDHTESDSYTLDFGDAGQSESTSGRAVVAATDAEATAGGNSPAGTPGVGTPGVGTPTTGTPAAGTPAAGGKAPAPDPANQRRKSRKPAVPAWEDVLLGVRSNGNS